jgi:hypothetical protein
MRLARQRHIDVKHQLLILAIVLGLMESLRLALHPKNSDSLNGDASLVLKRASHAELAVRVLEVDLRHRVLHNRLAVVEIQRAHGGAIKTGRNDNVETLLAQCGGGVGALNALRVDDAALVVNRDVGVVDLGGDVFAASADGLAGAPFVEDVVGEIVVDACAVLLCDGADKDAVAIEELQVDGVGVGVVRVVEEQRVEGRSAGLVLFVDGSVDVVDWVFCQFLIPFSERRLRASLTELVSDGDSFARGLSDCWPAVELLGIREDFGVVAEERVEGAESCPPVDVH